MGQLRFWVLLSLCLIGVLLIRESQFGIGKPVDEWMLGRMMTETAEQESWAPVVLVEINQETLELQPDWPWLPLDYTLFLRSLEPFSPSTVAILPVLSWPPDVEQNYLSTLETAAFRSAQLVTSFELGHDRHNPDPFREEPVQEALPGANAFLPPQLTQIKGDTRFLPEFPSITRHPGSTLRNASHPGVLNMDPTIFQDDTVLTYPAAFRYQSAILPSLPVQIARLGLQASVENTHLDFINHRLLLEKQSVSIEKNGSFLLDYRIHPFIRTVSYHNLLLSAEQLANGLSPIVSPAVFFNKIVLLGKTDASEKIYRTPAGQPVSSAELIALATATLLSDTQIAPPSFHITALLFLGFFLLCIFYLRFSPFITLMLLLITAAVYFRVCLFVFATYSLWLPLFFPMGLLLACLLLRLFLPTSAGSSNSSDQARTKSRPRKFLPKT